MTTRKRSGADSGAFLNEKSAAHRDTRDQVTIDNVLVIDDEAMDADRMRGTLRVILGYDVTVRHAATLAAALDLIIETRPSIILLDDILKPSDDAVNAMPYLRRAGYEGPIVVISGQVTRRRLNELITAGAAEVIHKDDVDSVRLSEALTRVLTR